MARPVGYAPLGERLFDFKPKVFCKNYTLLGGMTRDGMVAAMTVEGGTSVDVFLTFVLKVLLPKVQVGQVIVLDNLAAHKNKRVVECLNDHGLHPLYTPPYSPEWNPIELAWSKLKNLLRTAAAHSFGALEEALRLALCQITPRNARRWIRHCGYLS